jgi:hypothetical protein
MPFILSDRSVETAVDDDLIRRGGDLHVGGSKPQGDITS